MIRCSDCWRGFDSQEAKAAHHCPYTVPLEVTRKATRASEWRWGHRYATRAWGGSLESVDGPAPPGGYG